MNDMNGDGVPEPDRRRRWSGERLLFLVVGIVLCGYAAVSFLMSR